MLPRRLAGLRRTTTAACPPTVLVSDADISQRPFPKVRSESFVRYPNAVSAISTTMSFTAFVRQRRPGRFGKAEDTVPLDGRSPGNVAARLGVRRIVRTVYYFATYGNNLCRNHLFSADFCHLFQSTNIELLYGRICGVLDPR